MIKKLNIKNFKKLKWLELDLKDFNSIEWKNGEWKSSILQSIIYVYTWLVDWKQNKEFEVSIELDNWQVLSRVKWMPLWDIPKSNDLLLSSIIPWYFNNLTISDKTDIFFSTLVDRESFFSSSDIKTDERYNERKKNLKAVTDRLNLFTEQMISNMNRIWEIWEVRIESITELKEKYDAIEKNIKTLEHNKSIALINEIALKRKTELEVELKDFIPDNSLHSVKEDIQKRINEYNNLDIKIKNLREQYNNLNSWVCPTCKQSFTDNELLGKIKSDWIELWNKLKEFNIDELQDQLRWITKRISEYEVMLQKYRELQSITFKEELDSSIAFEYTMEEYEDIKIKLDNIEWLFSKQKEKEILTAKNEEIQRELTKYDLWKMQSELDMYYELNQKYLKEVEDSIKWFSFDIKLFEQNKTNDWYKKMFNISKDWIELFYLNRSMKMLIDIELTLYLQKQTWIDFILIDDAESFSKESIKLVNKITKWKQVLITFVKDKQLWVA